MSMMDLTVASLSKSVEQQVPELYVIIAKNSVVGLDAGQIADLLGVSRAEIEEVYGDELYKNVRLLIASEYAKESVEADFSWDGIETAALKKLVSRVPLTNDTDQLLRIAAVANKAQRRHRDMGPKVLDPQTAGARVALNLTDRIVRKLSSNGDILEARERRLSVTDGSATNPTFAEVDQLLGVSQKPHINTEYRVKTSGPDFTEEDLRGLKFEG
jgi:hypothetical protein